MSETDPIRESLDLPDLWARLQDLEDGSLSENLRDELMEQLNRSPAARRAYLEYFHQVAVLRMEAAKLAEGGQLPALHPLVKPRAWWVKPWLSVAAAVALAALIGALMFMPDHHSNPNREESLFAMTSRGTRWEINGSAQAEDAHGILVRAGDSVRVHAGSVKLGLESGASMVVEGASLVGFPTLREPVVREGWLWIDTDNAKDTFKVSTPDLFVQDMGTRFGVRVAGKGHSEIHLLEGGVNVISQESGIKLATLASNGKGYAILADGTQNELPLARDPFPLLQNELSGKSPYGKAVLSQRPMCYWTFNAGVDGRFDNAVFGGRSAKCGPSVALQPAARESRFTGFDSPNQSLYFPAHEKNWTTSVVAFLDGSKGVSQQQGAMTFWIRQKNDVKANQVLWLAGKPHPTKPGPTEALAHTYLTKSGHVVFTMTQGKQKLSVQSNKNIEPGTWHHIGVSWSKTDMDLYIDGEIAAHLGKSAPTEDWDTSGTCVRFGKPTDELSRKGFQSFHGWLDEYSLWDRPLTPDEVAQQFQAALGTGTR